MFNTPILFIVFNRPKETQKVFEQIKKIKPKYLYIAADGPRSSKIGEQKLCLQVKEIFNTVDWDCELKILFREDNLGCGKNVSLAIDWFFENVEEGIILEDDCVPNTDFFIFCEKALEHFKIEKKVFHIDGSNFIKENQSSNNIFQISHFPLIWGWATWRDRWQYYEFDVYSYDQNAINKIINSTFKNIIIKSFWKNRFSDFLNKRIDTWDYQWMLTVWSQRGLVIRPVNNLIVNIGFGDNATHTAKEAEIVMLAEGFNREIIFENKIELIINRNAEEKLFLNRFMRESKIFMYTFYIYEKIKKFIKRQ